MSDGFVIECPSCGYSETVGVTPPVNIGADISAVIDDVRCSKCGYGMPEAGR